MIRKVYVRVVGTSITEVSKMSLSQFNRSPGVYYCYATKDKLCTDLTNADIKQLYLDEKAMWDANPASKATFVIFCEEDKSFYINASGVISKYGVGTEFGDMDTPDTALHPESLTWQRVTLSTTPPTSSQIGNLQLKNSSDATIYAYWNKSSSDAFIMNTNFSSNTTYADGGYQNFGSFIYKIFRRSGEKISALQWRALTGTIYSTGGVKGVYTPSFSYAVLVGRQNSASRDAIPTKSIIEDVSTASPNINAIQYKATDAGSLICINNYTSRFSSDRDSAKDVDKGFDLNSDTVTYVPFTQGTQDVFGIASASPKKSVGITIQLLNAHGVYLLDDKLNRKAVLSQSTLWLTGELNSDKIERIPLSFKPAGVLGSSGEVLTSENPIQVLAAVCFDDNSIKYTVLNNIKIKFVVLKTTTSSSGIKGVINSGNIILSSTYAPRSMALTFLSFDKFTILKELNLDAGVSSNGRNYVDDFNIGTRLYNAKTRQFVSIDASTIKYDASQNVLRKLNNSPNTTVHVKLGSMNDVEIAQNVFGSSAPSPSYIPLSSSTFDAADFVSDIIVNASRRGGDFTVNQTVMYVYPSGLA